ncbi:glycosyltransferase [Metabacillus litoralis]|uniref:glycosyltransferase n=1 Tax=Metabacillus litoralis TaxID=152268 RepID=UPI001CFD247D|nr:glycosyltransferase [Metabacillus litoralis]
MKRVGMFVWNHFTNDARVLRECTTLSQNGYDVELICIDDPKDPNVKQYEEYNEHFRVYRLKRYPTLLTFMQSIIQNKWLLISLAIIWAILLYFLPITMLIITVIAGVLLKTKARVIWVRGSLILRMIIKGYSGNYDIYHSNDLNTLPQGYISAKWRFKKKTLIYDSHEVQTSRTGYENPWYKKFEHFFIKRIDSMIVENNTRAKYNEELYGFYPYVLHNYPFKQVEHNKEKVNLHKMLSLPEDEKILLYQGGIQTGRGLDKLIEAFPKFNEGTLVLIGDGRIKDELQLMVKEKGLEDKIKFISKVPLQDLPKYTRNAYLGFQVLNNVCFNHYSASSNKLFEYMMSEVPVVACDFPEIKKVVIENKIGLAIDPHDPDEIAKAVNDLLQNSAKRDFFSGNCVQAREKYNWEVEQGNLLNVYRNF